MSFKIKLASFVAILGLGVSLISGVSQAATGQIYISPSSTSVQINNNFSVNLRINPGTSVNTVQATINYNAADMQWLSNSLGSFSTCTQNSGGGGSVTLACAMLGSSTSSDSLIATVNFQALAGSGSTNLSVSNAEAANNGTYTDPSSSGASVSFSSPAPAPSPTPTPSNPISSSTSSKSTSKSTSSTSSSAPSSQPTTASPAPTPPPTVTINTKNVTVQFDTASFNVVTNIPVQVFVQYGTSQQDLNVSTTPGSPSTSNTVSIDQSKLVPGTTYYYQVVAQDSNGNLTKSTVRSFTTKGFTVEVKVLDSHNLPLTNQTVTLHSVPITTKTNAQGIATFTNVAPGVHHLDYATSKTKTYSQLVYVNDSLNTSGKAETAATQSAAVVLPLALAKNPLSLSVIVIGLLSLIVVGLILNLVKPFKASLPLSKSKLLPHDWHVPTIIRPVSADAAIPTPKDKSKV